MGHKHLLVTHTLYPPENYSEAQRRSVRRASGFVLVANPSVTAR
jgi:hypothetical protein